MSAVAENTKRIIKKKGLKQGFVGRMAGYSDKQFSDLLNGKKTMTDEHIVKIAKVLEVTANELFNQTDSRT